MILRVHRKFFEITTFPNKTNSKKEDKRDAATNALIASVDGMINKKELKGGGAPAFQGGANGCFHGDPKEEA